MILWGSVLAGSVLTSAFAGGTVAAHIIGLAVGGLALRQAAGYWRFLGDVSVGEVAI